MKYLAVILTAIILSVPGMARAQSKIQVVSTGNRFEFKKILKEEGTTVVLFLQDTSTMEREFLANLEKMMPVSDKVILKVAKVNDLMSPAALQYSIKSTPTAIIYDRFAHEIARTSQPDEIRAAIRKGQLMARIKWIDEDDPRAPEVYGAPKEALKKGMPGIVKTMGLRPEAYKMFNILSEIHFRNGFLKRREHEMVAAYVSSLNKCKF